MIDLIAITANVIDLIEYYSNIVLRLFQRFRAFFFIRMQIMQSRISENKCRLKYDI